MPVGALDSRVAIVTGSGRGIGRSGALLLASQGASVVVNDLGAALDGSGTDTSPAQQVVTEITGAGGKAVANGSDIADHAAAEELVKTAISEFGRLDILVNVAGILRDRMIFNMTAEEWDAVIRVHLRGTFNTSKFAAAHWRSLRDEAANNRIINFTSVSGLHGAPGQPNYAAAKMGIVGLTYSCANALGRYGVTANAVAPQAMTRMLEQIPEGEVARELRASTAATSGFGALAACARRSPVRTKGRIKDRVALAKSPRDSPTPYWMTSRCFEGT